MAKIILALALAAPALVPTRTALKSVNVRANARSEMTMGTDGGVVLIGVAADSGCGKSTFMRRLTSIFGGESKLLDIGRETNTLVSDMTTVICLDDYHKWDRTGRKSNPEWPDGITALHEACGAGPLPLRGSNQGRVRRGASRQFLMALAALHLSARAVGAQARSGCSSSS